MSETEMSDWSDDKEQQMLALESSGLTRAQIAAQLGVTKGVICGRFYRVKRREVPAMSLPPCWPPVFLPALPAPKIWWDTFHGRLTESELIARLEVARKSQEIAWYKAGYSREQITAWFEEWPTKHGYPAYAWSVGDPPTT